MATVQTVKVAPESEAQTRKGFYAPCPKCGEMGSCSVKLADLNEFYCAECEDEFTLDEVREFIHTWSAIISWIDLAPVLED